MLEPATDPLAPGGVLRQLEAAAAVRRAARIRVADAVAESEDVDHDLGERRRAFATATTRWVHLLKLAAAAGHPVADIARAAGVASSSMHYRLRPTPANPPERPAGLATVRRALQDATTRAARPADGGQARGGEQG